MKNFIEKLEESDGFLIARIGSESHRRFAEFISKWDLGMYQQAVLTALLWSTEDGVASQKQLGEITGIDPRNLVPIIDSLEERNLIKRLPKPDDRRRFGINLTPKGKTLAQQIESSSHVLEEELLSSLKTGERKALHVLLLKLYQSIEMTGSKGEQSESKG